MTERVELIPYGDMERWTTRVIKESALLGGATKEVYHLGPEQTITGAEPWVRASSDSGAGVERLAVGRVERVGQPRGYRQGERYRLSRGARAG